MVNNTPNAKNFGIDFILGNLDIDENFEIQNELFENDTDASETTVLDEDVLDNIHEERILTELPTTPEILIIEEDDISEVHIDQKNKASMKRIKKKLQDLGTVLFVFIVRNNIPNKSHIRCMFQCAARKEKSKLKMISLFIDCLSLWLILMALH